MQTNLLSEAEFDSTFATPMREVTASATNVLNIGPYVAAIPSAELSGSVAVPSCVEHVYRNASNTFDHVLLVTNTKHVYLVVVVDLVRDTIFGHRVLDLKHKYGLSTNSTKSILDASSPISRTWAAILVLLFAGFVSLILTPQAEAWAAIIAVIAAALAFTGFRHRPFKVPGLIADAIVFLLASAMVVAAVVHRFNK